MINYNEKLDALFEKWKNDFVFRHFFQDGLMYRGQVVEPYWRSSGEESKMWHNASKRIMFLLKDINTRGDGPDDDDDIRGRIFTDTSSVVYRNMSYWLYGILKTIETGEIPEYTFSVHESTCFFDNTAVAYVNCKKEAGGSSVSYNTLVEYIERDRKYIAKEIEILNPDIVICGAWTESTGNPIFDFVKNDIYKEIKKINSWMYYCDTTNKLIVNSYHPATRVCSGKVMYNDMMDALKDFLDKYPNFIKSCRISE